MNPQVLSPTDRLPADSSLSQAMTVVVALEHRFLRTPEGHIWTQTMFAYPFWQRYLDVFDAVRIVARVKDVDLAPAGWQRADGAGVAVAAVPYYVGPREYVLKARQVRQAVRAAVGPRDAVILRVSSQVADCVQPQLHQQQHPYAVEVVGDPYDVFAPGAVKHPLRPLFRWLFPRKLRRQCQQAAAAAYVTESALQRRYPPAETAYATYYSDVELPTSGFVQQPRQFQTSSEPIRLIFVGTLSQLYKAPEILLAAVAACIDAGLDLRLTLVGEGQHQPELQAQAKSLNIAQFVNFRGQLSAGEAVRAELDRADIFVLPSRQEGLPRAMVEAMARGLPCIGSTVGGIPELLPDTDLVPPNDVAALAETIRQVATNPERMMQMSARNLAKAQEYQELRLRERRLAFYRHLRDQTELWLKSLG